MSYLGNTPTQQNFVAGADQFSGTGSQTAFTLSRVVNTVFDIFVTVSNVPQDPFTAYTISGNTLTFDSAPPSGTNNIDVVYRATNVQTFVPSPGVSAQFGLGSAASPSMTFIGDTNTGIYSPAADTIAFTEGGIERMRLDSAGNVGIGTSSPTQRLDVSGNIISSQSITVGTGGLYQAGSIYSDANWGLLFRAKQASPGIADFRWANASDTERMRIDTSGNFAFNSGYGSVATAYGCRAWVNFNGTGTVAIRASGNVTSITDNGVGDYTVNFTTAMPDANYNAVFGVRGAPASGRVGTEQHDSALRSTTQLRIYTLILNSGATADSEVVSVSIFR